MILDALETGFIEGDGPVLPAAPHRRSGPRPARSFADRTYCVAHVARLGARRRRPRRPHGGVQPAAVGRPGRRRSRTYRERFAAAHGTRAGPAGHLRLRLLRRRPGPGRGHGAPSTSPATSPASWSTTSSMSDHFKQAKGYESYGSAVDLLQAIGLEKLCEMYLGVQAWGTPDQIIERLRARRELHRRPRPHLLLPLRRPAVRGRRAQHADVRRARHPRDAGLDRWRRSTRVRRGRAHWC